MKVNTLPLKRKKFWKRFFYLSLAKKISGIVRYFDSVTQYSPLVHDDGTLFDMIKGSVHSGLVIEKKFKRDAILINGNFNYDFDIQKHLNELQENIDSNTRLIVVGYNCYLRIIYNLGTFLGLKSGDYNRLSFLRRVDIENLAIISGYEVVKYYPIIYFPFSCLTIGTLVNRVISAIPLISRFSMVEIVILRSLKHTSNYRPSLSIVIPARNEEGNIKNAIQFLPEFGAKTEVIFVEGHSSDDTWEEIKKVTDEYTGPLAIKRIKQKGKGKGNAVREGFALAEGELLTILDADLTMPPQLLPRFYEAFVEGHGEFINGSRLLYPMEGEAMRTLNWFGNIFFAKALSYVLGVRLSDSLCGTKLFTKTDYQRMVLWREDFGDFDPFGDFEVLFPASALGLKIIDIPIRYKDRTYGETNISRFSHGYMLLKMVIIGLIKIRCGK